MCIRLLDTCERCFRSACIPVLSDRGAKQFADSHRHPILSKGRLSAFMSDCAGAHVDLELHYPHMSKGTFSREVL